MEELKPTVGRIVHYKDAEDNIRPAIVTNVNAEGAVDLQVFDLEKVYPARIVEQGEGQKQWDWMPFQKDQQARLGYKEAEEAQSKKVEVKDENEVHETSGEMEGNPGFEAPEEFPKELSVEDAKPEDLNTEETKA